MAKNFNIDTTYGIEIEFKTRRNRNELAAALQAAGVDAQVSGYTHNVTRYWKLVTDASVSGGFEIVSPVLRGDAGFAELKIVCDTLETLGCTVDRQCGVHLHLGAQNEDFGTIQRFMMNYAKHEDSIDCLVPPSRRYSSNSMIKSLIGYHQHDSEAAVVSRVNDTLDRYRAARNINELQRCLSFDRYHKVNLQSYTRHNTIEVRQHSGSLSAKKIEEWTRLMGALFASSRAARSVAKRKASGQTAKFRLKWLFEMTRQGETRRFWGRRARALAA